MGKEKEDEVKWNRDIFAEKKFGDFLRRTSSQPFSKGEGTGRFWRRLALKIFANNIITNLRKTVHRQVIFYVDVLQLNMDNGFVDFCSLKKK